MYSIVNYNDDQHERKGYATDFNDDNFENDLDIFITSTDIERNRINSGCVYSDINNQQQNLTLQLLSAITNIKPTVSTINQLTSTTISYCRSGQLILLNNWENSYNFTSAFPYLFSFGTGSHLE